MLIKILDGISSDTQALTASPMLVLRGITAAEAASTADVAEFVLRHGAKATSPMIMAPANFAADGFLYPTFWPDPIPCPNGVFIDMVAGTVTIVLYYDLE